MTISIWRYSHLALAVSSFLFIALAAVTGIVLAFDPVTQKMQPYRSDHFDELTLAKVIPVIKEKYTDVTTLTVDYNHFVTVKATDTAGKQVEVYVNAATGAALGPYKKQSDFFQWVTALHRSLFLHETGRIFIGITAFLLFLIAISGTILVIKRQRGVKRFFTKVVKDNFAQYAHVTLGRLSLIPIIIIALSGTYLSLENFGIIGEKKITYETVFDSVQEEPVKKNRRTTTL
ncbi:PepSY-associated TM helix domain-containing protein [Ferruginibacter sp.]